MVHLLAKIRGRNRRIFHGTIVTVRDRTDHSRGWGMHRRITGRVYSLGTGSDTVLVKHKDSEVWYPVADVLDAHMSTPIEGVGANGTQLKDFIGSYVRVLVFQDGIHGWGGLGWRIRICQVRDIDLQERRVHVEVAVDGWAGPTLTWYPIGEVRSVVWEL